MPNTAPAHPAEGLFRSLREKWEDYAYSNLRNPRNPQFDETQAIQLNFVALSALRFLLTKWNQERGLNVIKDAIEKPDSFLSDFISAQQIPSDQESFFKEVTRAVLKWLADTHGGICSKDVWSGGEAAKLSPVASAFNPKCPFDHIELRDVVPSLRAAGSRRGREEEILPKKFKG